MARHSIRGIRHRSGTKLYHRAYYRLRRAEKEFRANHAANERRWRSKNLKKARASRVKSYWKYPDKNRRASRLYHRLYVRKVCYSCRRPGLPGRYGRGALREVTRNLSDGRGGFAPARVLWCGRC